MRHPVALTATLFSIVLAVCVCDFALDPSLDATQYARTSWKIRDGVIKGWVAAIAQTPDGYLWLGTEFGLVRFDGVRPLRWQPGGNVQLPPRPIFSLLVSRDGTLWIGTIRGLASWKDSRLTRFAELDGEEIYALAEDRDGTVWAGAGGTSSFAGRLCAIRNGAAYCFGGDGRLGPAVLALYRDSSGNLWAGVKDGLWRWKPGPPKFYPLPGEVDGIHALAEDNDGVLLVGCKGGVYRFFDGKAQPYPVGSALHKFRAHKMLRDRDGALWIGTTGSGLLHVHQGRTDVFSATDDLSVDDVLGLFEDREGNLWTSAGEGLSRFHDTAVATLRVKQGLSRDLVVSVLADTDGAVWLATRGGLNRWDHGQITIPQISGGIRDGKINGSFPSSVFQDDRGRIWISTSSALGYLENWRFTSIKGVPAGNILSITQDTSANLWVLNEPVGLVRISPQNDVQQILWSELGHKDNATVLTADPRHGGLWIGFFRSGIVYFSDGQIHTAYTTMDGLGQGRVSDFYFDNDGTLWISTEGGLSRLKNNRIATLSSKNGLPCDAVHSAIEDNDQSLWLYTACGLVRINHSELGAWSAAVDERPDAAQPVRVTVFDDSDGVRSLSMPVHCHPEVAKTPDGRLWFLPWDGVSVIDPHNLPINKLPPPVRIEKITADGKTYDPSNGLSLPARVRDLAIDYTALSLVAPEKIHFRYKLEGQDPDWREVVNKRQVEYSNLAPRHYTFRVMACNNSGVWNETGASLEFSVLPAFYQTNWFRALCALGFLTLLWGIYQIRVKQLQHQFAIRLNERERIARELHDTLLQNLHGLMFQFQAVRTLIRRRPDDAAKTLENAINDTRTAIEESQQAIQGLRSEAVAKGNLAELLRATSRELADSESENGQSPVFELIEEGEPQTLSPTTRSEVCRIALEILRNAYRHAHAHRIEAEIRYGGQMLRLRIRDDGSGIDPKVLKEGGKQGHWGLRGIRERAERIGAQLDLWTQTGSGTEVELAVPAAIAYENGHTNVASRLFDKVRVRGQRQ